ncbi:ErfK/YbiS/YcfS/YnhG family protein [Solidesulfovibrio fructosivorans JJ]]|uniref:ErfK/YbiS/YcfS/YnhG family protein n=1 Tax=Solidesulfovibrio fructosivorans JJ] TaxID=596151 RepID=E1JVY9_SOLFR|nr:hypothetical protein [Solidesulfovibrio fructosivorans]EFL51349.1 ErfK/YbiS/YcfS/YnhG family protein [Solidesulfovibrio fructosivorans JJ]]
MPRAYVSLLACLFSCLLLAACQAAAPGPKVISSRMPPKAPVTGQTVSPLAGARQLVLVVTDGFDDNQAAMRRFERSGDGLWRPVGAAVPVTIGKNGMAWGRGLLVETPTEGPIKVEGDGRSPAGVFAFGTAFAYQPETLPRPVKMPMHRVTDQTVCVETVTSASYNRIVDENTVPVHDWTSPDRMLRPDGLYRYGLMVEHNAPDTKPAAGSCIFFHLWRRPGAPTVGCTAMRESSMLTLLGWIDAAKKPVVVQLPRAELQRLAPIWGAPELAFGDAS